MVNKMKIDCHAHFDPKMLSLDAIIKRMDKNGINKTVLMSKMTSKPTYIKSDFLMGIQRFLLFNKFLRPIAKTLDKSFHRNKGEWNPWYRKLISKGESYEILTHPDNSSVFDAVSKYSDRLMGWIFLNPKNANWEDELNKWKDNSGAVGIKIHPFWHRFSMNEVYKLGELAEKYNYPLMIHLGFDSVENINNFCTNFSNLTVIFSHAGFPLYEDIWPIIESSPRIFVDLSSHHVDKKIVKKVVKYLGADHCLFGTDDPYGDPDAGKWMEKWIKTLDLNTVEENKIFSDNFLSISNHS